MVSFEGEGSEVTIAQTASDIIRMMILQRRQDTINSFNHFEKERSLGIAATTEHIKANLTGLFLELAGPLEQDKELDYEALRQAIQSSRYDDLRAAFDAINKYLYRKELTKFDNRQKLGGNIVERNKKQGAA